MFVGIRGPKGKNTSYREYVKQYGSPAPKILKENEPIIDIVYNYYNLFIDGMGGLNSNAIISILDVEDIDDKERSIYLRKIQHYMVSSMLIRQKETTFKDNKNG